MPITKSAQKALRQSAKRRRVNLKRSNAYKTTFKEFKKLAAGGDKAKATEMLDKVYKTLDKAAKRGVIKKNKSARLKSRAAKVLKA